MRAILGGAAVLASAALGIGVALAASFGGVAAVPPVTVIRPPANTAGSASASLTNSGSASVTVGELVADGTCDDGVTTSPSVALPFAIAAGASRAVDIACAATSATTIRRCQFHARTATHAPIADYTGLCVSPGTFALELAPPTGIAFGGVALGAQHTLTIRLTNTGSTTVTAESIHVADQAGDFVIGSPCPQDGPGCDATVTLAPGGTLDFDLRCAPTQLFTRTTQLFVTTANGGAIGPYTVTCTGVSGGGGPSLSLDVPSVELGSVPVATGSAASIIDLTNIGNSDLHIASFAIVGGAATDWSFTASSPCAQAPCTLAAGASVAIDVAFDPSALDGRASTLQIHSDDASHPTTVIALDGSGLGATLAVDGTNLGSGIDLGSVAVGATSTYTLALRNDGNAALTPVTLAITQSDTALAVAPATLTIGPSTLGLVTVTCTPTDHVTSTGTLAVTAASALTGSPIAIALTCTGTSGSLVAAPSPIQLGEIRTGTGVAMQTITLSTLGAPVTITSAPQLTSPQTSIVFGALSSTQVTAAAPASFTLAIDPEAAASLADHISIGTGTQTLDVPITGSIVTAVDAASATRDLGSFCVGEPTATAIVSLTASGTASIGLPSAPGMAMGDSSPFQLAPIVPSVFPFTIPAGARATAQVTAKRESLAGMVTDDVVWTDDIAGSTTPRTTVQATFIDDGGAISPGSIDFGSAPIHIVDANEQVITIQNCGTEAMTLAPPTISPSGGFFTSGALPAQLLPAQAATLTVGFAPVEVADGSATLVIPATLGTVNFSLTVALHGAGIITTPATGLDAGTGPHDNPSGCGCRASGDPASLVVFAMCAFAYRRRRRAVRLP